jgi:hypothetical protein
MVPSNAARTTGRPSRSMPAPASSPATSSVAGQDQQRRQPVPAQLGELQVNRVQKLHQREGHDGHDLQHTAVQADGDEPEPAVTDHKAQAQE